jgi:beta-galactosidase
MNLQTLTRGGFILAALVFITLNLSAQSSGNSTLFNSNWKFHKGDVTNGPDINFADNDWRTLNLPHDWGIEGPFSEEWASGTGFLPAGIGWYRKTFTTPADAKGKKTYVYFEGVYDNSEVWINGHYLGKRPNGFVSFQYDMTPYLKTGRNVIAVKVDHSHFADSRWYTGSGIYRDVYLITKSPLHIGLWGVNYTTPRVSATQAHVKVNVNLVNESKSTNVTINCKLVDKAGQTVASASKNIKSATADSSFTDLDMTVKNPQLWSVDKPNLYKVIVSISNAGKQTDQWQGKTGIRTIKFDPDNGFFLNGINMKLKGVCIHDDAGALGVAVPKEVWYRRLKLLKEAGTNAIRMSHNPHAPYFYDLCDELGLMVMDEAYDEWEAGKNKWVKGRNVSTPSKDGGNEFFTNWYDKDVRDMVLRDRTHASIIMWSIGNEIDYPNDPYTDPVLSTGRNPQIYGRGYDATHPAAARMGEISKLLAAVVKKYDTTRPVTSALAGVVMSNLTSFPDNLDVVGYNYQEFRYPDDHKAYPKRIIYGSENSMALATWNAVDSNAYISGQFLWTGIDYLGEANRFPSRASGPGLMDLAGIPKTEYYFRQSLWSNKPMVYLTTAMPPATANANGPARPTRQGRPTWNYAAGNTVRVSCVTNCPQAELFLNGQSLGKKQMAQFSNRIMTWDVPYAPGELIVKGYDKNGKTVTNSLKTAGEAYAITATIDSPPMDKSSGLAQIIVQVVDKNGVPVYSSTNDIKVEIAGGAKLLGLESGNLNSTEDYKADTRKAVNGRIMAYIQSENNSPVNVVFKSPGLQDGKFSIPSKSHK